MKAAICLCALVVVTIARPEDKNTSKYENLDVKEILGNPRLLNPYIQCGLGQGKCTNEAKELIFHMKAALKDHCAKCTVEEKAHIDLVFGYLINHEPDYWRQLSVKYDPTGKSVAKYEEELKTIA